MSGEFQEIDIDGHAFSVLAAREHDTDAGVMLVVLLRLTHEQLSEFRRLFRALPPTRRVQVRRVGLDSAPITAIVGGFNYWSRHQEGDTTYYKQILRLLPSNTPLTSGLGLAPLLDQEIGVNPSTGPCGKGNSAGRMRYTDTGRKNEGEGTPCVDAPSLGNSSWMLCLR